MFTVESKYTMTQVNNSTFIFIADKMFGLPVSVTLRLWQTRTHCCGHIVANTNVFPFARAHNISCGHKFCVRDTKSLWFCSETFCVRNKCFPVCAAQETSWATMCPRLPGPLVTDRVFSPSIYGPSTQTINLRGKTRIRNLQCGPRRRG